MTARRRPQTPFPVRGALAGRDPWDDPDDTAALRAEMEEAGRQLEVSVLRTRHRLAQERTRQERRRRRRQVST